MKGIVFTEFLDLVESKFGLETVQQIIDESELESNGVYTSVGTYKFNEMVSLLTNLSKATKIAPNDLLRVYGLHFFDALVNNYGSILKSYKGPIELLSSIEGHIHVQVRKLYPDAELPQFETLEQTDEKLVLIYRSSRSLYPFAHGLMEKSFEHYGQNCDIKHELLKEDGSEVRFEIVKK
ncbi:heme NO-binding domain-containing protein [Tenacibaculum jejuense]|uniref:Heme NO Binding protein n=1 Tax=Tenacibaculum jejuense TaxID=584609 RepID=A0A238UEW1_9FLAO|nr:heme NO-binding domain-containing protein [Tenacibaculum jejuense]SNR17014.1 Heme NO Binding protein [Tenacibaculum jejuense]